MKKIFTIIILLTISLVAYSQHEPAVIDISDIRLVKEGEKAIMSFNATVGTKLVKCNSTMVLTPVLKNVESRVSLKPIVVQGRNAEIANARIMKASGAEDFPEGVYVVERGDRFEYQAEMPCRDWLDGSFLVVETVQEGCGASGVADILEVAAVSVYDPNPPKIEEIIEPKVVLTTGDMLAAKYPFVENIENQSKNRDNSQIVFFKQSSSVLDLEFKNNKHSLETIVAVVREIEASSDSRVARVVIAGYASPEGTVQINSKLGYNRANVTRGYVQSNTQLKETQLDIHNGGVDWDGLRKMVEESDIYEKYHIINIIDNVPESTPARSENRLFELKKYKGGRPYRHMYYQFFPELRNAAYIRVYYENNKK